LLFFARCFLNVVPLCVADWSVLDVSKAFEAYGVRHSLIPETENVDGLRLIALACTNTRFVTALDHRFRDFLVQHIEQGSQITSQAIVLSSQINPFHFLDVNDFFFFYFFFFFFKFLL
jgi:hypothetical protein